MQHQADMFSQHADMFHTDNIKPPSSADWEQICTMYGVTQNIMQDQDGVQH
jgi:transposase InsO family protein